MMAALLGLLALIAGMAGGGGSSDDKSTDESDTTNVMNATGSASAKGAAAPEAPVPPEDTTEEDTTGHGDHGDHGGDDTAGLVAPGKFATSAEIETYLNALFAQGEDHAHNHDSAMMTEHMAALDLAPRDESTNVAIANGDWSDPDIWASGEVPTDADKVLIPEGVHVTYSSVSDDVLFTVRVDGTLDFATDTDSQMIFDTMIVSPSGELIIGTQDDPVEADVNVDLIVANNGPIDVEWDPMLLSRGLISHGKTSIHGAEKDSHEKVNDDPMTGDTSVSFDELPTGWQVGDTIVVAGTYYEGYKWSNDVSDKVFTENQDEVRVISSIEGDTVHFEDPLVFDHGSPRDDLHTSVANYTRNVSIETEDPDTADVSERGHVMFMHSDDVDVRYAEFHELGRTDKSETSDDVSNFDTIESDSNVQGRYSLHLHRTGTEDQDNPAIVMGNAVYGSPGWGFVHHDSNALLENNASYDTFGAGYVAETGNETGSWTDNIAIFAQGTSWGLTKVQTDLGEDEFDTARGGDGFWFQGRMVSAQDNVAASVTHGFSYFHRDGDDRMIEADTDDFAYDDAILSDSVVADDIPILIFDGNEVFASYQGLSIVKHNPNQGHDVWSELTDFTAWSVQNGMRLEYTAHYLIKDFDLIGKEDAQFSEAQMGIDYGPNTYDIVVVDSSIDGFETGVNLAKILRSNGPDEDDREFQLLNVTITNTDTDLLEYDPALDNVTNEVPNPIDQPFLTIDGPLEYVQSEETGSWGVEITGTKTDSAGETEFPRATESIGFNQTTTIEKVEKDGYWTTSDGEDYFLQKVYFTDRITGDVFYETHPVYLGEKPALGTADQQGTGFADAKFNGVQDIVTHNGMQMAGDVVLGEPQYVEPAENFTVAMYDEMQASMVEDAAMDDTHDHSAMAMAAPQEPTETPDEEVETPILDDAAFDAMLDDIHTIDPMDNIFTEDGTAHAAPAASEIVEDDSTEDVADLEGAELTEAEAEQEAAEIWAELTEGQGVVDETHDDMAHDDEEDDENENLLVA